MRIIRDVEDLTRWQQKKEQGFGNAERRKFKGDINKA